MSELERALLFQIKTLRLPAPALEYRFNEKRRWRFDFAWPDRKIAAEVEGGIWSAGRHTRGSGFEKDCEKYNTATLDGWRVYRFTNKTINSGDAGLFLEKAMKS